MFIMFIIFAEYQMCAMCLLQMVPRICESLLRTLCTVSVTYFLRVLYADISMQALNRKIKIFKLVCEVD